jgi:maleylpyruvate isomerase
MKLYNYHASSASFRVRMAMGLKGMEFEYVPVRLRWRDGEQEGGAYREINPQGKVPVLVDGKLTIAQSVAIVEYLEEVKPEPALLPRDRPGRARVRSLALFVACEIHPLNNLRVERQLVKELELDDEAMRRWRQHWISVGFDSLETELARDRATGRFCHGDAPTMADCFLVPQVYKSQLDNVALDLARWPTIARIHRACMELPAVASALPVNQPDAG